MAKQTLFERGQNIWSDDSIRMILTPSSTAKQIYFYTQEIGYFKTVSPYFSERENLDSFLILYTLSGTGKLDYEGQTYRIGKGDCFFIHCMQHHLYAALDERPWEFLWIHFNSTNALGYYKKFTENGFQIVKCRDDFPMEALFRQMILMHQKKDCTTEPVVSNMITQLLTELLLQTATDQTDTFSVPDDIRKIAREIERNYASDLSLRDFELLCHRSRFCLSREFKKYMGITINESLILTRISCAKELLKYSDLSVSEIASACGIHHVSHFINLFRDREGLTPLTYRKAWKE